VEYLFVLAVGLVAGTVSGIVGTGSSIMLVPVLVYAFGPKEAVPIMAVAALIGNVSRVLAWWRAVDWRACAAYAVSGMPAAVLGAKTLLVLPARVVDLTIGCFLIAMVPTWRFLSAADFKLKLWHLTILGAAIGYLTGIVVSTGPLSVPVFLAYGLLKGAFIATEAAASLGVYVGKTLAFREFGALPMAVILKGLIAGSALMAGSFVAKHFMVRLAPSHFRLLMDGLLLAAGASMLWAAL
jgi:uncharacterized membrane protein YfcA